MFTNEEVENIVKSYIEQVEKIGYQSGGSGHMGFVSYDLREFNFVEISEEQIKITFKYIVIVETEFTYYPDNPSQETEYEKEIIINNKKEIISERTLSGKGSWNGDDLLDPTWLTNQTKILDFIEKLLAKIEWQYGDNRAPFKYPPEFIEETGKFKCIVTLEDDGGKLIYESENSEELASKMIDDLRKKFYPL